MAIRAVGAIVYQRSESGELQILLIKKRGGMWTLPKGKVRHGEDDRAALLRELAEETGLDGRVGELVTQTTYTIIKRGRRRRKVVTYYLVYATGGHLQPGTREGHRAGALDASATGPAADRAHPHPRRPPGGPGLPWVGETARHARHPVPGISQL